ncbi:MAG TPA: hypothetical protein VFY28_00900 [Candidatus Paceibacterota bacterium]|nr:hypothetical protein [Candidatus Paceibacterota bacterium]
MKKMVRWCLGLWGTLLFLTVLPSMFFPYLAIEPLLDGEVALNAGDVIGVFSLTAVAGLFTIFLFKPRRIWMWWALAGLSAVASIWIGHDAAVRYGTAVSLSGDYSLPLIWFIFSLLIGGSLAPLLLAIFHDWRWRRTICGPRDYSVPP